MRSRTVSVQQFRCPPRYRALTPNVTSRQLSPCSARLSARSDLTCPLGGCPLPRNPPEGSARGERGTATRASLVVPRPLCEEDWEPARLHLSAARTGGHVKHIAILLPSRAVLLGAAAPAFSKQTNKVPPASATSLSCCTFHLARR